MIKGIFDSTIGLLDRTLDLRARRQDLIASNIANQETPGYRAVDLDFEGEMKKSVAGMEPGKAAPETRQGHIPLPGLRAGGPAVIERASDNESYDGNTVGLDAEMVKLAENTVMYNTAVKMLRSKFAALYTAIKEGGR